MNDAISRAAAPRPRLLIISYACSPYYGSEPGIGWNYAFEMAKYFDTWVISEGTQFADEIRRYKRENGSVDGPEFVFVDEPSWTRIVTTIIGVRHFGYVASQRVWQRRALDEARGLHERLKFDVVLKMTMCTYREPGYGWQLGIPFVWGPFGGTQNFPWRFAVGSGWSSAVYESFRTVANWIQLRTSHHVRQAARAAKAVIAANRTNASDFAAVHGIVPVVLSDVGVRRLAEPRLVMNQSKTLRLLWCGILEPRKALPVLLDALAQIRDEVNFELRVVGEGPYRTRWQRRANKLGLDDRIVWCGKLTHAETLEQYQNADVFAFTSLRDTTGTVVVEAIAAGLPVIAFDHQGVRDVVNASCGIKIPVETPAKGVEGWAAAIRQLATDPALRVRLSRGARVRAHDYLWSVNGQRLASILFRAIGVERHNGIGDADVDESSRDGLRLQAVIEPIRTAIV
jgi:glycosyltransferase involved in cell wall biosynthesis